jgi:Tfp pilus assembly pilus retraction ATPase PilT
MNMASSGKLVLASTHGARVIEAWNRMVSFLPKEQAQGKRRELAACMKMIIVQQLVKRKGKGLVPAHEILNFNPSVQANFMSPNESLETTLYSMLQNEMANNKEMNNDLYNLYCEGAIDEITMRERSVGAPMPESMEEIKLKFKQYKGANRVSRV